MNPLPGVNGFPFDAVLRSFTMKRWIFVACGAWLGCSESGRAPVPESHAEPAPVNEPLDSRPLKQGFTQRPSPDTPGLPPPIAPLLDEGALERAQALAAELSPRDRDQAQKELRDLVEAFERDPSPDVVDHIRETATAEASRGRLSYMTVASLYAEYLFPHDVEAQDAKYKGKLMVLEATVAPHNMKDMADGFKLVEQNPYVHDPLLLATDYELSFVECHLAHPEAQPLRDWQPIHVLAEVEGKKRSDVLLRRCIVF